MSKEEILKKLIGRVAFQSGDLLTQSECYECMQEFADQEKEKVTVAFAEWKENNVLSDGHSYHPVNCTDVFDNIPDLYQYFINNVYNK